MQVVKHNRRYLLVAATILLVALIGLTFYNYDGTVGPFLLFNASFLLLVLLAIPRPRLYVYTFLSLFLFLGFWTKFIAHTIVGYDFVEPVGDFDGSGPGWDRALVVASVGAVGVILTRGMHLLLSRRYALLDASGDGRVPAWYPRFGRLMWAVTLLSVLVLNFWNLFAGFYQIGLEPRLILPAYLNVATAWLINFGFALWIAALVHWEILVRRGVTALALLAPLAEGFVSATSTLSRKAFLFHTLPYVLVLLERRNALWRTLRKRSRAALALLFVFAFALSLVTVSAYRLYAYSPTAEPQDAGKQAVGTSDPEASNAESPAPVASEQQPGLLNRPAVVGMTKQVLGLSVDRWTGLEGVLTVTSHTDLGSNRLLEVVKEDPSKGESSIYQGVSGANKVYAESERTTFMTLPGIVGILGFSGSLLVVAAGMFSAALLLIVVEMIYMRAIGGPFVASVAGLAMATTAVELNFPQLTVWFFAELFATLSFVWLMQTVFGSLRYKVPHESS